MFQLVYISTARGPVAREDLDAILAASRRNNRRDGVTGLLVAGGRRFLQALEGEERNVRAAFDRIAADPRHHAIVTLVSRPVAERRFGDWAMAHQDGGAAGEGDLARAVSALVAPLSDRSLRAQFEGFAALHRRAA